MKPLTLLCSARRFTRFNHLPWLLVVLPAYPVVGQSLPNAGGPIGTVPGFGTPAASPRPDVAVAPGRGTMGAGHPSAGIGLRAAYQAGAPRGAATYSRFEPGVGVTWRGAPLRRAYRDKASSYAGRATCALRKRGATCCTRRGMMPRTATLRERTGWR